MRAVAQRKRALTLEALKGLVYEGGGAMAGRGIQDGERAPRPAAREQSQVQGGVAGGDSGDRHLPGERRHAPSQAAPPERGPFAGSAASGGRGRDRPRPRGHHGRIGLGGRAFQRRARDHDRE